MFKKYFPHVFVFFAFLTLIALGTWQVERREWKQNIMNKIDARITAPPIPISAYSNITDDEFKQITLTGNYLHNDEILILNKPFNGKAGQYVFTPFKTTSGEVIEINRGWVPTDQKIDQPEGHTQITGIIRATQKPNWLGKMITLENKPQQKIWFWIELPKLYGSLNLPQKDFYVEQTGKVIPLNYPYPLPPNPNLYNEHLQYAITWYLLAGILLIIYYCRFWYKQK